MYQIVKSITFALFVLFANMLYAQEPVEFQQETLEFKEGLPEGIESIEAIDNQMALDAQGNWVYLFAPQQEESISSRSASSYRGWYASAYGPGLFKKQYFWYRSELLSSNFSQSGYISRIQFWCNCSLNGWQQHQIESYLVVYNRSGNYLGHFDLRGRLSNTLSGSVNAPYHRIPASSIMMFTYRINRQPELRIYGGPVINTVNVRVNTVQ